MVQKTLIAETEHVIAIEQELDSDSVVVTFNPRTFFSRGLSFWCGNLLLNQGVSAIGIVTTRPNWYPQRAMAQIVDAVLPRIKGRKVVTLGSSQGGYGALKYSARLHASAALAFSPQWSINPADVGSFDTRCTKWFDGALGNGLQIEQADLCDPSFVLFDKKYHPDAENAARLLMLHGVTPVLVPFSLHRTIRYPLEGGGVAALIRLCVRDSSPTGEELRQAIRQSRLHSQKYFDQAVHQLILRLSNSSSRPSKFLSRMLGRTKNDNPMYPALLAYVAGHSEQARSEMAKLSTEQYAAPYLPRMWRLSNTLQFVDAELAIAEQIFEKLPGRTDACLDAVSTFIQVGNLRRARAELARIAGNADAIVYVQRLVQLASMLKDADVIEALLSDDLSPASRAFVLFRQVELCIRLDDRPRATRKLVELSRLCAGSPPELRRVSDLLRQVGGADVA